jgi:hypothetical protein
MIALFLLAAALGIGAILVANDQETLRAGAIVSILVLVSLPLFWLAGRADHQGRMLTLLLWTSFWLKVAAHVFRFQTGLLRDAYAYDSRGQFIASQLARGMWPEEFGRLGSDVIRVLTGFAYYWLGVTFNGVSVLWLWFGLLGMLFFYLAFATAFPHGHRRLYMVLVFLYPSMLLWTSSLGKDALVVMFMGMAAYGAARAQRRVEVVGLWWLLVGVAGVGVIRPHVAAMFTVALGASFLVRPIRAGMLSPILRLVGLLAVAGLAAVVIQTAQGYVGLEEVGTQEVFRNIEERQEAARGGAAFEQVDVSTPAGFAMALPTIILRPFPWEAHNNEALIASLEGVLLLVLLVYRRRSVIHAVKAAPRDSYALLLVVYILLFVFFFSSIGNFGILARQRASQLFPFLFMLIAYLGSSGDRSDRADVEGATR